MPSDPGSGRDETFTVEGNFLVQRVVASTGQRYRYRCPKGAFQTVARAVVEAGEAERAFTVATLAAATHVPGTQVAVALALLKRAGYIAKGPTRSGRAPSVADPGLDYADAMDEWAVLEWRAIQEKPGNH